jgi:hypothetical protein
MVIETAIVPVVVQCVETVEAMHRSDSIAAFRTKALELAHNEQTLSFVKKQLHKPTTVLRAGQFFNESTFLSNLESQIKSQR